MGTRLLINSCWQRADTLGSSVEMSVMSAISLHEFQVGCPQPATVGYCGEPARSVTCQNTFLSLVRIHSARRQSRLLQTSVWDRTWRQAVIKNKNTHVWCDHQTSEKSRRIDSRLSWGPVRQGFNNLVCQRSNVKNRLLKLQNTRKFRGWHYLTSQVSIFPKMNDKQVRVLASGDTLLLICFTLIRVISGHKREPFKWKNSHLNSELT